MTAAATVPRAAFRPEDPDLAGYVVLDFTAFDWLEDDEEIIGHPRDPFHRVDIRASSAERGRGARRRDARQTNGAQLLYETLLPVRYYIPPSDVRLDLMEESPKRTVCPYKGQASYWSYPESGQGRNIAWSYDRRFRDAAQIHGLISFFNERVDLRVDGVLQHRPVTPWSAPRTRPTAPPGSAQAWTTRTGAPLSRSAALLSTLILSRLPGLDRIRAGSQLPW